MNYELNDVGAQYIEPLRIKRKYFTNDKKNPFKSV